MGGLSELMQVKPTAPGALKSHEPLHGDCQHVVEVAAYWGKWELVTCSYLLELQDVI